MAISTSLFRWGAASLCSAVGFAALATNRSPAEDQAHAGHEPAPVPLLLAEGFVLAAPSPQAGAGLEHEVGPVLTQLVAPEPELRPFSRELGVVPRRDPVEPPLLDRDIWQEWVLSVRLNGVEVSDGALFAEDPQSGALAMTLAQARQWRLRVDESKVITLQGVPFYPVSAIPGAKVEFERDILTLDLELPPESFEIYSVGVEREGVPPPRTAMGAFLDYDLNYTAGGNLQERLDGLAEAGAYGELGVLTTSFILEDLIAEPEATRLETRFTRDLPQRRTSLRLGDSLTGGADLAQPIRFGGVQYATNFATDPSFVTFPVPAIGGLSEKQSVVEVFIDNLQRLSRDVPPGPFSLENLPVVTGAGELQLRITDLLGRERVLTQPYYVTSRLLKEGLHDFSYELGVEREDYALESFQYGGAMAAATHRYGLTNSLTVEAHAEAEVDRQSLSAGGALLLGRYGVVSAAAGLSTDEDAGQGALAQAAYEYDGRRFNLGLRTRYTSEDFRQFGDTGRTERVDQANLGIDFRWAGRLGLFAVNEKRFGGADRQALSATYSLPLGPGTLIMSGIQQINPDDELILGMTYSMPIGRNRSFAATARLQEDRSTAGVQFRQGRGASDLGLDYRLATEVGDNPRTLDARASYQTDYGTGRLELERFDGSNNMRVGIDGSFALVGGALHASRRLGSAFGLVSAPGFPNVRVYLDNREVGRTDQEGQLLLPGLRPYQANMVRLEIQDLPLDAQAGSIEQQVVPFHRSGILVAFDVTRARQATVHLVDQAGMPLPAGLELADETGGIRVLLGRDGFATVTGGQDGPTTVRGRAGARDIKCDLPPQPQGEILPDLGTIGCR